MFNQYNKCNYTSLGSVNVSVIAIIFIFTIIMIIIIIIVNSSPSLIINIIGSTSHIANFGSHFCFREHGSSLT